MDEYADYFADLEGGSAIGRSVEPQPFDVNSIGKDAALIRTSDAISAPLPMPITSGDFRSMNLMARRPLQACRRSPNGLSKVWAARPSGRTWRLAARPWLPR